MEFVIKNNDSEDVCSICANKSTCAGRKTKDVNDCEEIKNRTRLALNENCAECLFTKFRAGIMCGEWAKMNANLYGGNYTISCPFKRFFDRLVQGETETNEDD